MTLSIRSAAVHDLDSILRINAACVPNVAMLDALELHRLLAFTGVHLVAADASGVIGYLLAMHHSADYDGEEFQHFRRRLGQPYLYIDQVAIAAAARRDHGGTRLYQQLEQRCTACGIHALCCEVNLRPANPSSLGFHEKLGFNALDELETRDGRHVALLLKRL